MHERVVRCGHPCRSECLDALVEAVGGPAAVVDHGQYPIGVPRCDDRRVEVTGFTDLRFHPNLAEGVHLVDLGAGDEARHVEVVHGHVEEDPT